MYGYRGPQWTTDDTVYLSEIAEVSRKLAEQIMEYELRRTSWTRLWIWHFLEHIVWWSHDPGCQCAIEMEPDPQVKVRTMARAVKEYLNEQAAAEGVGVFDWLRQHDFEQSFTEDDFCDGASTLAQDIAKTLVHRPRTRELLSQARTEVAAEKEAGRKRRALQARSMVRRS